MYCPIPILSFTEKPIQQSDKVILAEHSPQSQDKQEKNLENFTSRALEVSLNVALFASRIVSMMHFSLRRIPSWTQ